MTPFNRLLKTMLRPWIAVGYLGFVLLSFCYFDKPIAWFLHNLDLKAKFPFISWLTKVGLGEFYVAALFLLVLVCRYVVRNKEWESRTWFIWLCVVIPYSICGVLKVLLGRARPDQLFDNQLYGFYGMQTNNFFWSFPSGHTTTITGLVCGLCIVFPRHCHAFFMAGFLVILSRVLLTNHYLSDVMATSFLTLMEVGLLVLIIHRKHWFTLAFDSNRTVRHTCHECT